MNEMAYSKQIVDHHYFIDVFIDPYNKRLRVDDYRGDMDQTLKKIDETVADLQVEKLIVIGRSEHFTFFLERGFQCEAMVDHYYRGSHAYYFTKYFSSDRKQSTQWMMEDEMIQNVSLLERSGVNIGIPEDYELIKITKAEVEPLAMLYQQVFRIYPTPLHDPAYILKTIERGTIYYAFVHEGNIVSAASAEINSIYFNAELTDCATLSSYRKFGLIKVLLKRLEHELRQLGIFCAFSIARAQSFGMNAALHQLGYEYRGRLLNNCFIFERLENMNMWVKDISRS